jgi:hypothetical protein
VFDSTLAHPVLPPQLYQARWRAAGLQTLERLAYITAAKDEALSRSSGITS